MTTHPGTRFARPLIRLRSPRTAAAALAVFALVAGSALAQQKSDLLPPAKRRPVVEMAQRLAQQPTPPPLPAELNLPFNPAAFGQPDPEELRALAAAKAAAAASTTAAAVAAKPSTDRDFLSLIAARIMPSGTLILGGEPLLIFGKKRLRLGDHLTVTYENQDYDLELIAIDRTTFTLRLNHEEITRPIKPGK